MIKVHRVLVSRLVEALGDVFVGGYYADKVIERHFKAHPKWGARDRRQFAEAVYEVTRWWRWYWHLAGLPDVESLDRSLISPGRIWLVWGAYRIDFHGESSGMPECQGLTPEVVERRRNTPVSPAIRASVPDWLHGLASAELGEADWNQLIAALNLPADVFLRANPLKNTRDELAATLDAVDIASSNVPEASDALRLERRQNVFATQAFREGLFEVQDAASQQIVPFLQIQPGQKVIDACAGAGGKTLHMAGLMGNKGRILALDIHDWKLKELRKRAARNQVDIVETRPIDPKTLKRLRGTADRLLLDVPCSGLGVLRRNPDAKWKLSPEEIGRLRVLQAGILTDYSRMVKPGGKMVYATCSLLPGENEFQVEAFLRECGGEWEFEEQRQWRPDREGFDGFFAARLRKRP